MDYLRHQLHQNAFLEYKIRISVELMNPRVGNFKIGKTIDTTQERFDHDEEYREMYDEIKTIYETEDKALVDDLERNLDSRLYDVPCQVRQQVDRIGTRLF